MKQMSLIEMDGFLKDKCIPRDLKVNETNAEYLVRKFAEAEAKCAALAAENAGIKSAIPESRDIEDDNDNMDDVSLAEDFGFNHAIERMRRQIPETPTTDAFLAEVRAQGVDAAIEAAKNLVAQEYEYKDFKAAQSDCCMHPGSDLVGKVEMTEWLVDFAAQLRKGGNQ
ncbi:TPA: ead/Ea22-like family protein [Escherichia coli]